MPGRSNPPKLKSRFLQKNAVAADILSPGDIAIRKINIALTAGIKNPDLVWWAAYWTSIPYTHALAVVEQETNGANTWGHDGGPEHLFFGHAPAVSADNWLAYKRERDRMHEFQGADIVQHTSQWWQDAVDTFGGADQVLPALLTTFEVFKRQKATGMTWLEIFTDYNGSPEYGAEVMAKVDAWKQRLGS